MTSQVPVSPRIESVDKTIDQLPSKIRMEGYHEGYTEGYEDASIRFSRVEDDPAQIIELSLVPRRLEYAQKELIRDYAAITKAISRDRLLQNRRKMAEQSRLRTAQIAEYYKLVLNERVAGTGRHSVDAALTDPRKIVESRAHAPQASNLSSDEIRFRSRLLVFSILLPGLMVFVAGIISFAFARNWLPVAILATLILSGALINIFANTIRKNLRAA